MTIDRLWKQLIITFSACKTKADAKSLAQSIDLTQYLALEPDLNRLRGELRTNTEASVKMGLELVLDAIQTACEERERSRRRRAGMSSWTTIAAALGVKAVIPQNYAMIGSGLVRLSVRNDGSTEEIQVCSVVPMIRRQSYTYADGEQVELVWKIGPDTMVVWCPTETIMDHRKIVGLSTRRLPVCSGPRGNAAELTAYLHAFKSENAASIETGLPPSSQLGWSPDFKVFMLGNLGLPTNAAQLLTPAAAREAEAFTTSDPQKTSFEQWIQDVFIPCMDFPHVVAAIYASLATPLVARLNTEGLTYCLGADPGTGKTTAMNAAASVWGNPDRVCSSWDSTQSGAQATMVLRGGGLPIMLGDVKDCRNPEIIQPIVYAVANGHSRERATVDGGKAKSDSWKLLCITSSEQPLSNFIAEGTGGAARIFDLMGNPFGERSADRKALTDTINQVTHMNYGWAGYRMIRCLTEPNTDGFSWEFVRAYWRMWQDRYGRGPQEDYRLRMARAPALIQLARSIGEKFLGLPELDTEQSERLEKLMVRSMNLAVSHLDRVANFKNRLESMLTSSASRFYAPSMGVSAFAQGGRPSWYGFYSLFTTDDGYDVPTVCFIVNEVKRYFEDAGVLEWKARFGDLAKEGLCVLSPQGDPVVQRTPFAGGPRPRVFQVRLDELGMDVPKSVFVLKDEEGEHRSRYRDRQYS